MQRRFMLQVQTTVDGYLDSKLAGGFVPAGRRGGDLIAHADSSRARRRRRDDD
jgi:hypothetical protein